MLTEAPRRRPVLLCIDDDPAIALAIRKRLSSYEVDVRSAHSGAEGLFLVVHDAPDVIITDLSMPNGCGDYVVECLKGRVDTCDIPVIVLTGRTDAGLDRWLYMLGVDAYLRKPIHLDAMIDAVRKFIGLSPKQISLS